MHIYPKCDACGFTKNIHIPYDKKESISDAINRLRTENGFITYRLPNGQVALHYCSIICLLSKRGTEIYEDWFVKRLPLTDRILYHGWKLLNKISKLLEVKL